jgi:hypothetical protein
MTTLLVRNSEGRKPQDLLADLRTWCRTHITCDWKVQEGGEETDEIDEQSGGLRENWVVFVVVAAISDAQLMIFKMEFVEAEVMTGWEDDMPLRKHP